MEADFTAHVGEYFALMLHGHGRDDVAGQLDNLLMIFIALELTSLSLYILAAFNKRDLKSAEAALKYFLFGGMAAAFTLFGLSLVYGLTGSTNLRRNRRGAWRRSRRSDPLLLVALVMTMIGFGFKVAAVPFHLWAPDAYQGAPTPERGVHRVRLEGGELFRFRASVMVLGFAGRGRQRSLASVCAPGWVPVLAVLAAASMVLGNLAAIVAKQCETVAGLLGHRPRGLHAAGLAGRRRRGPSVR